MAESVSDLESDTSSIDGGIDTRVPSAALVQQLNKRLESLQQENRVLRMELDTYRYKCKSLEEDNRELKKARVTIQLMAEQQEEYISNTLLKKIQALKNEKEQLARNYEQEEEFLTNDLSRKLFQLRQEKCELEETLEKEQEYQVNKLMRRIEKLQQEVLSKQATLEQLKKDKVELENQLEQEQEALVNRLWKRMDKLEAEKRMLQQKLDQPVSAPPSPRDPQAMIVDDDTAGNLVQNIQALKAEVFRLQAQLRAAQAEHKEKIVQYAEEERHIREENLRLQRKLQMEIERREQLCRHLSESESSLEMDDERHFNEMTKVMGAGTWNHPISSPIPVQSSGASRPMSPDIIPPGFQMLNELCQTGLCGGVAFLFKSDLKLIKKPLPIPCPKSFEAAMAVLESGVHFGSATFGPSSPLRSGILNDRLHFPASISGTTSPVQPSGNQPRSQSGSDKFVKPSAPPPISAGHHSSVPSVHCRADVEKQELIKPDAC